MVSVAIKFMHACAAAGLSIVIMDPKIFAGRFKTVHVQYLKTTPIFVAAL